MYDWLPQDDIVNPIKWVLKIIERKSRRSYVTIFYKERKRNKLFHVFAVQRFARRTICNALIYSQQ